MDVSAVSLPSQRVAAVSHVGPYATIGRAFGRLGTIAGAAGLIQLPGVAMVGIYYDDPSSVAPDRLRSDAGLIVPDAARLPAELHEVRLAAGRYARLDHHGPYDGLGAAWAMLKQWVDAHGHAANGPGYEKYLNTPEHTAPADLRTELYLPLR